MVLAQLRLEPSVVEPVRCEALMTAKADYPRNDDGLSTGGSGSSMTPEHARLLAIGFLTSAANALTVGGARADAFAGEQVDSALPLIEAIVCGCNAVGGHHD